MLLLGGGGGGGVGRNLGRGLETGSNNCVALTSPLLFGVETVLWPRAAKKSGKWYRGVVDAAGRFMTR